MKNCLNTGHLAPQSLPDTGFAEFLPFWQWWNLGDSTRVKRGVPTNRVLGMMLFVERRCVV